MNHRFLKHEISTRLSPVDAVYVPLPLSTDCLFCSHVRSNFTKGDPAKRSIKAAIFDAGSRARRLKFNVVDFPRATANSKSELTATLRAGRAINDFILRYNKL